MRKKNKRLSFDKVEVLRAGAKGKAIGKVPDGRVIFLSNAVPGDVVDVMTTKMRKAYLEGVATRFHKLSDKRATPVCQHFGVCGGCKWQDMAYGYQLEYKEKEVADNLRRIGHLDLPDISPIIGSRKQYFYRNKLEFSFSDSRWLTREEISATVEIEDRNAIGFHIPGMWDKVLDIKKCHLQEDPSNAIRLEIKHFASSRGLTFFNPRQQKGLLRTLMIRTASTGEIMVLLQFYEDNRQDRELLLEHIDATFPEIDSLLYVINKKPNDTLYDQEICCFRGKDFIIEEMEGLRFRVHAKSFYQTNSEQAYELYKVARDFAGLTGKELVYDLYSGTGTIAQFVARHAARVVGIEAVPDAINAARINAADNGISNTTFFVGDMKSIFNSEFIAANGKPDVVITDPPREGMHKDVVGQILEICPEKVVYVSCNSATQARDLALMKEAYHISKIQPVDMFPQTHHVENVVLLEKRPERIKIDPLS
jgi:23S rRNA (uracil1939-C5)-methyltransferase